MSIVLWLINESFAQASNNSALPKVSCLRKGGGFPVEESGEEDSSLALAKKNMPVLFNFPQSEGKSKKSLQTHLGVEDNSLWTLQRTDGKAH